MNILKLIRRKLYRRSSFLRRWWFWLQFVKSNHYVPDFKRPKTYNEKINYRKNNPQNPLFSICADKIKAKEYVAEEISPDIIIPNYYVGESITFDQMKAIIKEHGDCLLKANHNSGPVYLLTTNSADEEIRAAVDDVREQLTIDFGKLNNEAWYSDITRGVLVEKRLQPEKGEIDIRDYKFHVFRQKNGKSKIILAIYFDRSTNRTGSYFTENLAWIPMTWGPASIYKEITRPDNFSRMIEYAQKLAEPFSYVRVDFYNVEGNIYFGELTFADAGGNGAFGAYAYDLWMGNLWQGDPRY